MSQSESALQKRISEDELNRIVVIAEQRAEINRQRKLQAAQIQMQQSDIQYQCKQKDRAFSILWNLEKRALPLSEDAINTLYVIPVEPSDYIRIDSIAQAVSGLKPTSAVAILVNKFQEAGFVTAIKPNEQNQDWLTIQW